VSTVRGQEAEGSLGDGEQSSSPLPPPHSTDKGLPFRTGQQLGQSTVERIHSSHVNECEKFHTHTNIGHTNTHVHSHLLLHLSPLAQARSLQVRGRSDEGWGCKIEFI
jgi:hypothetical protein